MISWNHFILFAIASVLCWTTGAWGAWKEKRKLAFAATGVGLAIFFTYIPQFGISKACFCLKIVSIKAQKEDYFSYICC